MNHYHDASVLAPQGGSVSESDYANVTDLTTEEGSYYNDDYTNAAVLHSAKPSSQAGARFPLGQSGGPQRSGAGEDSGLPYKGKNGNDDTDGEGGRVAPVGAKHRLSTASGSVASPPGRRESSPQSAAVGESGMVEAVELREQDEGYPYYYRNSIDSGKGGSSVAAHRLSNVSGSFPPQRASSQSPLPPIAAADTMIRPLENSEMDNFPHYQNGKAVVNEAKSDNNPGGGAAVVSGVASLGRLSNASVQRAPPPFPTVRNSVSRGPAPEGGAPGPGGVKGRNSSFASGSPEYPSPGLEELDKWKKKKKKKTIIIASVVIGVLVVIGVVVGVVVGVTGGGGSSDGNAGGDDVPGTPTTTSSATSTTILPSSSSANPTTTGASPTSATQTTKTVTCWGSNRHKQQAVPSELVHESVSYVITGDYHSCAVYGKDNGGGALCWGSNGGGQCNVPDNLALGSNTEIISMAAGDYHTCAIYLNDAGDAESKCWGWNKDIMYLPSNVDLDPTMKMPEYQGSISASINRTCVVTRQRKVACYGWPDDGNLFNSPSDMNSSTVDTVSVGQGNRVCATSLSAGEQYYWGSQTNTYVFDKSTSQPGINAFMCGLGYLTRCLLKAYTGTGRKLHCQDFNGQWTIPNNLESYVISVLIPGYDDYCVIEETSRHLGCWGDTDEMVTTVPSKITGGYGVSSSVKVLSADIGKTHGCALYEETV
eukprot:Nk52_evm7s257 gene=Nk52_evmTU7s257